MKSAYYADKLPQYEEELKKVKGTKPGFVTFRNYKTIYIDPYEDRDLTIVSI